MCQLLSLSHSPCGLFSLVRHVRLIISCLICKKEKVNHIVLNQTWNFMARLTHRSLPKKKIWYHTSRFPSFWDKTSASKILPYSNVYPGFLITQQANRSISDHFPYSSCSKLVLSINVEVHIHALHTVCLQWTWHFLEILDRPAPRHVLSIQASLCKSRLSGSIWPAPQALYIFFPAHAELSLCSSCMQQLYPVQ